jgi:hypothetical protein
MGPPDREHAEGVATADVHDVLLSQERAESATSRSKSHRTLGANRSRTGSSIIQPPPPIAITCRTLRISSPAAAVARAPGC